MHRSRRVSGWCRQRPDTVGPGRSVEPHATPEGPPTGVAPPKFGIDKADFTAAQTREGFDGDALGGLDQDRDEDLFSLGFLARHEDVPLRTSSANVLVSPCS